MRSTADLQSAGEMLKDARRSKRISLRKAAARAQLSETRWRQIEQGYELRAGMKVPVSTTPETLARMAVAVGLGAVEVVSQAGMDPSRIAGRATPIRPVVDEDLVVAGYRAADDAVQEVMRILARRALEGGPVGQVTEAISATP